MEQKKPLLFSSVGVQLVPPLGKTKTEVLTQAEQITPWKPYFDYALSITTRNPLDSKLIRCVSPHCTPLAYPDLCYAFNSSPCYQLVAPGARVLIPTNMSLKKYLNQYMTYLCNENTYLLSLSYEDEKAVLYLARLAGVHQGARTLSRLSPYEVVNSVLHYSISVMSARYHGRVLAIAAGVPDVVSTDSRYKSVYEPDWEDPTSQAQMHLAALKKALA